jgi:hypothetical protein
LNFAEPAVDEDYLSELAALEDPSPLARAQSRIETLETRLAELERQA